MTSKEALERIESTFAYNKKGKKNVYSIFMGEFKVIEEYYKDYNKIKQDLELLEALKQRWQQEEWCNGKELSVESLNNLFKYNEELFDKNLELDKKLESEFEDSADAICKALAERDKLLDENIELQIEIQDLKEKNKILNHNSTNIVMTDTKVMKRNLELQQENEKLKKAIEILNWDCPVSQDLISDLDCDNNCSSDFEECSKKCWRKYLLLEAKKNEN